MSADHFLHIGRSWIYHICIFFRGTRQTNHLYSTRWFMQALKQFILCTSAEGLLPAWNMRFLRPLPKSSFKHHSLLRPFSIHIIVLVLADCVLFICNCFKIKDLLFFFPLQHTCVCLEAGLYFLHFYSCPLVSDLFFLIT